MKKMDRQARICKRKIRTYEVVIHSVLGIILRDGVFSIDNLQLGPLFKRVLLKTQQVEDAPEGLHGRVEIIKTTKTLKSHLTPNIVRRCTVGSKHLTENQFKFLDD